MHLYLLALGLQRVLGPIIFFLLVMFAVLYWFVCHFRSYICVVCHLP